MNFKCTLLILALLLTMTHAMPNRYAAAKCCARGPACRGQLARQSRVCRPARYMSAQSRACRAAACAFCRESGRARHPICRSEPIRKNCGRSSAPAASTPRPAPPSGGRTGSCKYRSNGSGKIVIPLWRQPAISTWTRNGEFITWKQGGGRGLDRTGSGSICVSIVAPRDGTYYMTATSKAPHGTEHNDAWFRFSSPGLNFYRPQTNSFKVGKSSGTPSATGWHKGFQNFGRNRLADYVSTFDHNGHQFITKSLRAGGVYEACVSGRSSRFSISKLIFIHCSGREGCSRFNSHIKQQLNSLPLSQCR